MLDGTKSTPHPPPHLFRSWPIHLVAIHSCPPSSSAAKHQAKHPERLTPKIRLHCRLVVHRFFGMKGLLWIYRKRCIPSAKQCFLFFCFSAPPLIDYVSNNATVNETGSIILFCNATSNPQLNITWDFLSGPNPMNLAKGTTLTLANVNRNQAGTYRCKAENGAKANATANIHVTVNCE